MNNLNDILKEGYDVAYRNEALTNLLEIPKFVITGGVNTIPKVTCFMHKMACLGDIAIYKYDRPLIDMYCKIIEENYDLPEIIIFEDDACPVTSKSFEECEKSIQGLKNQNNYEWDLLYLGCNLLGNRVNKLSDDIWIPLDGAYTTHAVLYKKSCYDYILSWKERADELRDEYNGGHAIDHWLYVSPLKKMVVNPMHFTQVNVLGEAEWNLNLHLILKDSYNSKVNVNQVPWL